MHANATNPLVNAASLASCIAHKFFASHPSPHHTSITTAAATITLHGSEQGHLGNLGAVGGRVFDEADNSARFNLPAWRPDMHTCRRAQVETSYLNQRSPTTSPSELKPHSWLPAAQSSPEPPAPGCQRQQRASCSHSSGRPGPCSRQQAAATHHKHSVFGMPQVDSL